MHLTSFSLQASKPKSDLHLIAENTDINLNALHSVLLPYKEGFSAKNIVPLFAKINRKSGIISEVSANISLDREILKDIGELVKKIGSTSKQLVVNFDTENPFPDSGNFSLNITNVNGCNSTIDIQIFGIKL